MNRLRSVVVPVLVGSLVALAVAAAESSPAPSTPTASPPTREGDRIRFGRVLADPARRTVSFPARVQMTRGLVEYAVVTDYGKTHESLLVTEALPMDIQAALLLLRGRPSGTNALARTGLDVPREARVFPELRWTATDGTPRSIPFDRLFSITTGGADGPVAGSPKSGPWIFTGSLVTQEGFGAHFEGSIVALITDPIAIVNNPGADRDDDEVHVPNPETVPPVGTDVGVELRLEPVAPSPAASGSPR